MPIERDELEALFNSDDNNIEDERVMEYENRSKKANSSLDELEKDVSSSNLSSILNNDTSLNKIKKVEVEEEQENITLDDLFGCEELNVSVENTPEDDGDENEDYESESDSEDVSCSDDDDNSNDDDDNSNDDNSNDDDEITLDDLFGDSSLKKGYEDVRSVKDNDGYDIADDDVLNDICANSDNNVEEKYPDVFNPTFKLKATGEAPHSDCEKYINDPLYGEFYRQKLIASNFLSKNVPKIDYKKLREEMLEFHVAVKMEGIISLDQFNEKIQEIQSVRNRITRIKSLCIQNYVPRKRVVKLLEDCLMKESKEKSTDKRAGDIQIHMADMEYELALSEAFLKDVDQIMENITTAHEALSRQITVIQERNREIQRGQEPYIDSTNDKYDSVLDNKDDSDENGDADIRKKWKDIM